MLFMIGPTGFEVELGGLRLPDLAPPEEEIVETLELELPEVRDPSLDEIEKVDDVPLV